MKIEAVSKDVLTKVYRNMGNLQLLDEFTNSGIECARIINHHWKDAKSGASCLRNSIRIYRYGGVKVVTRNGEIYLVKT